MRIYESTTKSSASGQTLIETLIAIFILVSGITAALGLAIFAFSSSQSITKQSVAVGLAREGIEAVKNMRDTNWLKDNLSSNCYNPATGGNNAKCYDHWLKKSYDLDPPGSPGSQNYRLRYDNSADFWNFDSASNGRFGLDFDVNITNPGFWGFYTYSGGGVDHTDATSDFARKIRLEEDDGTAQYGSGANNPFNKNTGYRLKVIARVWWTDKKCPRVNDWPGLGNCSVELQTYLTNWKNY